MSIAKRRKRKVPYKSGYCLYAAHQHPCRGQVENGAAVVPRITLCSCSCHGDYEARLVAAGQAPVEETEDEAEDDD